MSDIRYENGKIYKIVDNTNNNIYIGSTIQKLKYRLSRHKSKYNAYLQGKCKYITSFDIIKNDDYNIELLELYPCNNKKELELRERHNIERNICVNKNIPTRTHKEYRIDKSDEIREYYIKNRDKILEKQKKYNIKNRDKILDNLKVKVLCEMCNCKIRKQHIKRHKKTKKHLNSILIK
tara:strand:- start:36 stop:572 length:537 start_codon:yes stop_codon:yes gene_type:complete